MTFNYVGVCNKKGIQLYTMKKIIPFLILSCSFLFAKEIKIDNLSDEKRLLLFRLLNLVMTSAF
ncbi:hypothetical protein [Leptospira weilii]|uniref:hypothetical protein n=1 Tax=Leptospira weilii TaxID=28184 RepID=UPI001C8DC9A9|nr:hypothetical protein [Leptospira weilii]